MQVLSILSRLKNHSAEHRFTNPRKVHCCTTVFLCDGINRDDYLRPIVTQHLKLVLFEDRRHFLFCSLSYRNYVLRFAFRFPFLSLDTHDVRSPQRFDQRTE